MDKADELARYIVNRAEQANDMDLLREALGALQDINEVLIPTVVGDNDLSMLARRVRTAITKLEERLLRE